MTLGWVSLLTGLERVLSEGAEVEYSLSAGTGTGSCLDFFCGLLGFAAGLGNISTVDDITMIATRDFKRKERASDAFARTSRCQQVIYNSYGACGQLGTRCRYGGSSAATSFWGTRRRHGCLMPEPFLIATCSGGHSSEPCCDCR